MKKDKAYPVPAFLNDEDKLWERMQEIASEFILFAVDNPEVEQQLVSCAKSSLNYIDTHKLRLIVQQ